MKQAEAANTLGSYGARQKESTEILTHITQSEVILATPARPSLPK